MHSVTRSQLCSLTRSLVIVHYIFPIYSAVFPVGVKTLFKCVSKKITIFSQSKTFSFQNFLGSMPGPPPRSFYKVFVAALGPGRWARYFFSNVTQSYCQNLAGLLNQLLSFRHHCAKSAQTWYTYDARREEC